MRLTALFGVFLSGCYLTHERVPGDAGGRPDVRSVDARSADVPSVDAPLAPLRCDEVVVSHTRALDDTTRSGVTPRLVVLPGNELGLVYVSVDGDPTRVSFERFSATLERIGEPVVIASDAFTWAEPAWLGERLAIAYGRAAADPSEIAYIAPDGTRQGTSPVSLPHPSFIAPLGDGVLWVTFDMRTDNAFLIDALDRTGMARRDPQRIEAGRYGSGFGLAALPDGGFLFGYAREGPPGVRQVYMRRVEANADLGTEIPLSGDLDSFAVPASSRGRSIIVFGGDGMLEVADIDVTGPAIVRSEQASIRARGAIPAFAEDRVIVATLGADGFLLHDFGRFEDEGMTTLATPALTGAPQSGDAVSLPGAAVFAVHVVRGSQTFPVLIRVECRGG